LSPLLPRVLPTAVHALEEEQETDAICPPGTVAFGEFTRVHAGRASTAAAGAANAVPADAATITAISARAASSGPEPPLHAPRPLTRMTPSPPPPDGTCPAERGLARSVLPRSIYFLTKWTSQSH